jgi:hypothetical protein
MERSLKLEKTKEPTKKEKNFWKIPLNVVKGYDKNFDNSFTGEELNSIRNPESSNSLGDLQNTNIDFTIKEEKVSKMPVDFEELFESNELVKKAFDRLPEHHKRQYILWVESSQNEDIRHERMERLIRIFTQRFNVV